MENLKRIKPNLLRGFTIIEVIMAIFVLVVGVVGIYSIAPRIVSITSINNRKFIASQLAREGIEIVRNIRDSNWLNGFDWNQMNEVYNLMDVFFLSTSGEGFGVPTIEAMTGHPIPGEPSTKINSKSISSAILLA